LRKAVLGEISESGDVCGLLFRQGKTRDAARHFLLWLRSKDNRATRGEVSQFSRELQQGNAVKGFSYRREHFYRPILKRLMDFGFIALESRPINRRMVRCYVPVYMYIPSKGPGGHNWWNLAYIIALKWNQFFWPERTSK